MSNPVIKEFKQFGLTALLHENYLQIFSEHSPDCKYHPPSEWAKNDVSLALANWAGETLAMRAASGTPPESRTLGLSQDDLLTLARLDPSGRALRHKVTALHIGPSDCYDGRAVFIGAAVVLVLFLLQHFFPQWMERLANLWWLFAAPLILSLLVLILVAIFYKPGLSNKTPE